MSTKNVSLLVKVNDIMDRAETLMLATTVISLISLTMALYYYYKSTRK